MSRKLRIASLCLGFVPAALAQNFVLNGGFESPPLISEPYEIAVYSGGVDTAQLTGWSASGNPATGINLIRGPRPILGLGPFDGEQFINFNGGNSPAGGILSQTFPTAIGVSYAVSYVVGRGGNIGPTVALRGQILSASNELLGQAEDSPVAIGWLAPTTFQFTATTPQTTLRFTDISPSTVGVDLELDSVSVSAVPEPGGYVAAAGLVLAVFGACRRTFR